MAYSYRVGEVQEGIVKALRSLADQIERTGIIEPASSISIERGMIRIPDDDSSVVRYEPTLERTISIKFIYAKEPTFTEDDNDHQRFMAIGD